MYGKETQISRHAQISAQWCGPRGQAGPEERGERARESEDARAEQSLLPVEDYFTVGSTGHQTLQAGHPATGLQLHRAPATDTRQ